MNRTFLTSHNSAVSAEPVSEGYTGDKKVFDSDPWPDLYAAMQHKAILQGEVIGIEKAGDGDQLVVSFGPVKGIVPAGEIGDERPHNLANLIGSVIAFRVSAVNRAEGVAYLSRQDALTAMASRTWQELTTETAALAPLCERLTAINRELAADGNDFADSTRLRRERDQLYSELYERGPTRLGTVHWVTARAAFLDIGGVIAALPAREIAWHWVEDARDEVAPGDSFDVRVYFVDPDAGRVLVSLRPFRPNPWYTAAKKYVTGGLYQGRVSRRLAKGMLVSLEPGLEAFVNHIPFRPEGLAKDTKVLVKLVRVDLPQRRMVGRIVRDLSAGRVR